MPRAKLFNTACLFALLAGCGDRLRQIDFFFEPCPAVRQLVGFKLAYTLPASNLINIGLSISLFGDV
jgi:hypothetical protein